MGEDEYELDRYSDNADLEQLQNLLSQVDTEPPKSNVSTAFPFLTSHPRFLCFPSIVRKKHNNRALVKIFLRSLLIGSVILVLLLLSIAAFLPSPYTRYPAHYPDLWEMGATERTGNLQNEKIFIAANIINEDLIRGKWGEAVKELVHLLGSQNTFLSIYENDSGPGTKAALEELRESVSCKTSLLKFLWCLSLYTTGNASIVSTSLPLSMIPTIKPEFIGHPITKRITYLATLRNLALAPLTIPLANLDPPLPTAPDALTTSSNNSNFHPVPLHPSNYTKILFLNDVVFSPQEAVYLLFETNGGFYSGACAMDFDNPIKFYDTFGLRNTQGDGIGLPLYPFFTPGISRSTLLSGSDSVPVKSCWGGMVAFNAALFTRSNDSKHPSVRFRSEQSEEMWEASECCLIHADIDDANHTFVNPFVRVSYTPKTFRWLKAATRIERVWVWPHRFLSWIVGMPWANPRKRFNEGDEMWVMTSTGQSIERIAKKGGFCGLRKLFIVKDRKVGGRTWFSWDLPKE